MDNVSAWFSSCTRQEPPLSCSSAQRLFHRLARARHHYTLCQSTELTDILGLCNLSTSINTLRPHCHDARFIIQSRIQHTHNKSFIYLSLHTTTINQS